MQNVMTICSTCRYSSLRHFSNAVAIVQQKEATAEGTDSVTKVSAAELENTAGSAVVVRGPDSTLCDVAVVRCDVVAIVLVQRCYGCCQRNAKTMPAAPSHVLLHTHDTWCVFH
jgi:hypothetical protein